MGARSAALAALAFACAAQAQNPGSVTDYQLPPAPSPAPPPAQGPVDPEHPVATPTQGLPPPSTTAPSADQPASPAPDITLPAFPEQPARSRPQGTDTRADQAPIPAPDQPASAPSASATEFPAPSAEPAPAASAPTAQEPPGPQQQDWSRWLLLAGLLVVLLAIGGLLWLRGKRPAPAGEDVEADAAQPATASPGSQPEPSAPANLTPIGQAPVKPAPMPALAPDTSQGLAAGPFEFRLEPQTLRLSFVYATLSYQLVLANRTDGALASLRVAGDLISGHASLPTWQQLSLDGQELEQKHEVAALAPQETATLKGELRVPLAKILALRAGSALLFAPLARFRVEATREGRSAFADTRIFTIGQPAERPGGAMQPFRLDLGPQLFRQVDRREVDLSRWLPLDEARRAG